MHWEQKISGCISIDSGQTGISQKHVMKQVEPQSQPFVEIGKTWKWCGTYMSGKSRSWLHSTNCKTYQHISLRCTLRRNLQMFCKLIYRLNICDNYVKGRTREKMQDVISIWYTFELNWSSFSNFHSYVTWYLIFISRPEMCFYSTFT